MKKDVFGSREAFPGDELSVDEVNKYKKQKKRLMIPESEIEAIKNGIAWAIKQPTYMLEPESRTSDSIDEARLFEQISTQRSRKTPRFLIHNFDAHSQYHTLLFTWTVFSGTTEKMMGPICYMARPTATTGVTAGSLRLNFQQQVASASVTCLDVLNGFEEHMACALKRAILRDHTLVFLFDWHEEPMFMFLVVFDLVDKCDLADMSLDRADFFITPEVDIEDTPEEIAREKVQIEADHMFYSNTLLLGEENAVEVVLEKRKARSFFISSFGQKVETEYMDELKRCRLRYTTYGYVLKESHGSVIIT